MVGSAQRLLAGLGTAVPRLIDRSRAQARFAGALVERARCAHRGSSIESDATPPGESPPERASEPEPVASASDGASVDAAQLAIPDYDALAASQVVPRLEGLTADELEAVRVYESAHRARRTILGRVAQLQA